MSIMIIFNEVVRKYNCAPVHRNDRNTIVAVDENILIEPGDFMIP
jgi:hypothetical protein